MRIAIFYHSLVSDWNHGNAHFLRGVACELIRRGHDVQIYEPRHNWSLTNLLHDHGPKAIRQFERAYPDLRSIAYNPARLDLDNALEAADVVIVHEWNDHDLVARIGEYRRHHSHCRMFFHDTHHRSVTDRRSMAAYDLTGYDGALAFGNVIRDIYLAEGWTKNAWTWHEAADTRVFHPIRGQPLGGDVVWIGNWGDEERTAELRRFLLEPIKALNLRAKVYGVRYPEHALRALADAGIEYGGYVPNFLVPQIFARYRLTVHVPRRPYVRALQGIPTIRPFEAMACGIPLICSPWNDAEHLFTLGEDYLVARTGKEMRQWMRQVLEDRSLARRLSSHGRRTILARHTCAHRVRQLLAICRGLGLKRSVKRPIRPRLVEV